MELKFTAKGKALCQKTSSFYDQIFDLCHSRENGNPEANILSRFRIKCGMTRGGGMTSGDTPLLAAGLFISPAP